MIRTIQNHQRIVKRIASARAFWRSLILAVAAQACGVPSLFAQNVKPESDYRFGAVTWMQKSAEYQLLAEQTYRHALTQLITGLHDRQWSADECQIVDGNFASKPPAVILDLDETVLDNSYYNARNILGGFGHTQENWNQWCQEGKATAVPGALDFVKAAEALGVKVFFITNREDPVKEATVKNLNELGFKTDDLHVLTKNDEAGRGDDKLSRRAAVAAQCRIVLLIGDSMSDLCSGMDATTSQTRNEIAKLKTDRLGSRWIMLPNPSYGGWQRALPKGAEALDTRK
jgi:acid phosphatase